LAINLRRVDLGQEIASLDPGADVGIPPLYVAAGTGIDGSVVFRLYCTGQDDLFLGGSRLRGGHRDGWHRCVLGRAHQCSFRRVSGPYARGSQTEYEYDPAGEDQTG